MANDEDLQNIRPPENITIIVARCANLKGSKGDSLNSLVRVEFGSSVLGESPKVETTLETNSTNYNFSCIFECIFEDPACLDAIASKPLMLTVIEVLPKDKKGKEEKTNILGQCCVDLIPLLQGETKFETVQPVHPVNSSSPPQDGAAEQELPEITVQVSVAQPLLNEAQLSESNLLSIHVDSAFSVPDAWQSGQQFIYTACLPVPITAERESVAVLPNGVFRVAGEKEPSVQRKWCVAPSSSGTAVYIPNSVVLDQVLDDEDGDLKDKEDHAFRLEAVSEKNRVTWNAERRCFLNAEAAESLQTKVAQNRYIPVEIMRTSVPQPAKAKGKGGAAEEETPIFYHGVAYVNMAPLLYPGVTKIRGAYVVKPFLETDVFEKTKRKSNLAEEAARVASGMSRVLQSAMGQKAPAPSKPAKADAKAKPSGAVLKPDNLTDGDSAEVKNIEGQQYLEARTFITLEIEVSKPLVPKRPPSVIARKVAECIPPRPVFARKTGGSKKSVEDYHTQVATVANSLLEEFRIMFGEELMRGNFKHSNEAVDQRKRKFLYELNTSGKYFAFKEQLKHNIIKIVREKYLHTTVFTDKDKLQNFLSELYVFLVDQMHISLNKFLSVEETPEAPSPVTDSAILKHFAREAEVNQDYEAAAKYYQERLARNKNDPNHWFDYGNFCLLIGDLSKAEECFKETIAINQKHVPGLLMYGVMSLTAEKYETAETFFEAATCAEDKNVIAWTMLGLYYDSIQNDIGAERAFLEANRLNIATPHGVEHSYSAEQRAELGEPTTVRSEKVPAGNAERDSPTHILVSEERIHADDGEVSVSDRPSSPQTSKLQAQPPAVIVSSDSPRDVLASDSKTPNQALSNAASKEPSRAPSAGSVKQPSSPELPPPVQPNGPVSRTEETPRKKLLQVGSIFLQAATFCLEVNALQMAESALAHELVASNGAPNAEYYLALGRLQIQQKQFAEAEENLKQAMVLQHQNPDVWALLGHLHHLTGNVEDALKCYERTLSYVTEASDMHAIYLRLASIYLAKEEFLKAKDIYLKASLRSPSCTSWLGVGIACYRLGELVEAEDALSEANILNNKDPTIWGYLALVCLQTGRQHEAEQSYKFTLKLNLEDDDLLSEIHELQARVGFGNPMTV